MDEFTEFQLRRLSDTEQQILAAVVRHLLGKIARNPDFQRGSIKRHCYRMTLVERLKKG